VPLAEYGLIEPHLLESLADRDRIFGHHADQIRFKAVGQAEGDVEAVSGARCRVDIDQDIADGTSSDLNGVVSGRSH
jgi:hypothetical protein